MGGEWRTVPVSAVADIVIGGTPSRKVPEYWGGSIPWATARDIAAVKGRYLIHTEESINEHGLKNSAAKLFPRGTIVITARGTVGALAQLGSEMAFNQTCYAVIPKCPTVHRDYLYYALKASSERMQSLTYGTVFETITTKTFDHWLISLPSLSGQRAIACVLGSLDDKIELSRKMNRTLEEMARALFKSWFIDFDPVRAKAAVRRQHPRWTNDQVSRAACPKLKPEIARLFPDSFEDSELGEIPKGWRVGCIGDVARQLRDQENPLLSPRVLFRHFSIPAFDDAQSPKLEYGENIKSTKFQVPQNSILLSKLNPEIPRVWMVDVQPGDRAVCSTEFLVLSAVSPFTRSFVYCLALSPLFRQQIERLVTGTSKSHQRAEVNSIFRIAAVLPPEPVVRAFTLLADDLLSRTLECRRESRTLAALRDALLPKLISGELRIHDAERIAARYT